MLFLKRTIVQFSIIYCVCKFPFGMTCIRKATTFDPYIISKQTEGTSNENISYSSWDGLLLYKGRVIIPQDVDLWNLLIHEMHDTKTVGH